MTTIDSKNVFNIAVKGNFDDCQFIIKKLFRDKDSISKRFASINSINWSRIMAQITYYIYSFAKLNSIYNDKKISYSVPTGNFGDAYAGYLAKSKFNVPINKIIVATNENDILNRFLEKEYIKKILQNLLTLHLWIFRLPVISKGCCMTYLKQTVKNFQQQ